MREVVLYQLLSLDGVAEKPENWFTDSGAEVFDNLSRIIGTQDDVLLGRKTYNYWADHWPSSKLEPFAGFINGTPKHVFTSSAPALVWANTTVVTTSAIDYVRSMREQPGRDIGIHGSIELSRSLLRTGLIDRLELVVAPAIVGGGRCVFDAVDAPQGLELLDVRRSLSGTVFMTYRCNRQ